MLNYICIDIVSHAFPAAHGLQAGNIQANHHAHHAQPVNVFVQSLVNV